MATPRSAGLGNFFLGILSFALFGAIAWLLLCAQPKPITYEAKRGELRAEKASEVRKAAHEKLNGYAWIDQKAGIVQLPIERAIELTVVDLKNKKVAASQVAVENPYPVGLSAPPAAAPQAAPAAGSQPTPAPAKSAAPGATPAPAPGAPKTEAPKNNGANPTTPVPTAPQPAPAAAPQPMAPKATATPTPIPAPAKPAQPAPAPAAPQSNSAPLSSDQKSSDLKK